MASFASSTIEKGIEKTNLMLTRNQKQQKEVPSASLFKTDGKAKDNPSKSVVLNAPFGFEFVPEINLPETGMRLRRSSGKDSPLEMELCRPSGNDCRQEMELCRPSGKDCRQEMELCRLSGKDCRQEMELCRPSGDDCRQEMELCRPSGKSLIGAEKKLERRITHTQN